MYKLLFVLSLFIVSPFNSKADSVPVEVVSSLKIGGFDTILSVKSKDKIYLFSQSLDYIGEVDVKEKNNNLKENLGWFYFVVVFIGGCLLGVLLVVLLHSVTNLE